MAWHIKLNNTGVANGDALRPSHQSRRGASMILVLETTTRLRFRSGSHPQGHSLEQHMNDTPYRIDLPQVQ
jgi:hypothetical protein